MRTLARTALAVFLLFAFEARAGQLAVIYSDAPGLLVGSVLSTDAPLHVPGGATVRMVSHSGELVVITGPSDAPPGDGGGAPGGDPSLVSTLANLVGGTEAARLGAIRDAAEQPPDPWMIDVDKAGVHCVRLDLNIALWNRSATGVLYIETTDLPESPIMDLTSVKRSVEWTQDRKIMPWPREVPMYNGSKFILRTSHRDYPLQLEVRALPTFLRQDAQRAAWMARNGCKEQARRLVMEMK